MPFFVLGLFFAVMMIREVIASHSPEILFSYAVEDREYRSDTYSFFEYPDNGRAAAQRITNGYPQGLDRNLLRQPRRSRRHATLNRDPSLGWLVGSPPVRSCLPGVWLPGRLVERLISRLATLAADKPTSRIRRM